MPVQAAASSGQPAKILETRKTVTPSDTGLVVQSTSLTIHYAILAMPAQAAASSGQPAKILETRKTVPGLRLVDKWAVLIGGCCGSWTSSWGQGMARQGVGGCNRMTGGATDEPCPCHGKDEAVPGLRPVDY